MDIVIAGAVLVITSPLLVVAVVGIRLSSPGPVLYRARRIGRDRRKDVQQPSVVAPPDRRQPGYRGREFTMYKFRTMHAENGDATPITASGDVRVFRFGVWLRIAKIDELPQLFNVLRGDMSLVGPRPEAPEIVRDYYSQDAIETLQVVPGLTSPGALYYYTHCESLLQGASALEVYTKQVLPLKLAIDRVYIKRASVLYDCRVIFRTVRVIAARMVGVTRFPDPPELSEAGLAAARPQNSAEQPA
jgi:lipopolysaccharide/colanic/teichoic acid biosynthesis glycosyltransferase